MKGLFIRLAIDGIRKNRRLYAPYILSIIGSSMIYYLMEYLTKSPALSVMGGGTNMRAVMSFGRGVMLFFSCIFLFYTNSFLTKKRTKEFALYHILGMNKLNVLWIRAYETLFIAIAGIGGGITCGILLSKLFEMLLLRLCHYTPDYAIYFSWQALVKTILFYVIVMLLLYLFTSVRILRQKPLEYLRSAKEGEKEPRANYVLAILGGLILALAYYRALIINSPASAISKFFYAVMLVIIATYLLFVAGSVAVTKLLKKNRAYYYNKKHFVAVSGMAYRMKRNGAGLASICILSTMVLVMISSVTSLYVGAKDSISTLFSHDVEITVKAVELEQLSDTNIQPIVDKIVGTLDDRSMMNVTASRLYQTNARAVGNQLSLEPNESFLNMSSDEAAILTLIPLSEYNALGFHETLADDEVLLSVSKAKMESSLIIEGKEWKVKGEMDAKKYPAGVNIVKYYYIVVPDFVTLSKEYAAISGSNGEYHYVYCFDLARMDENGSLTQNGITNEERIKTCIDVRTALEDNHYPYPIRTAGRAEYQADFLELYGSLLLLGIFLSITFISACALIMYYKQITEGYEDVDNFAIMRKVGMTKEEILDGVRSQVLITFFSPLLGAGLHLIFSFKMIRIIMLGFGITNVPLLILAYIGCYALFALFYLFVYRKTAKVYVEIVSGSMRIAD